MRAQLIYRGLSALAGGALLTLALRVLTMTAG